MNVHIMNDGCMCAIHFASEHRFFHYCDYNVNNNNQKKKNIPSTKVYVHALYIGHAWLQWFVNDIDKNTFIWE